jgi:hypothetical protein
MDLYTGKFVPGFGYGPAAAGPTGGWSYTPGPGFFGKQSMQSILPNLSKNNLKFGRRFGSSYPLMNQPSFSLNETTFPRFPVGPGNTPGGDGGVFLQGMPSFQQYWGFSKTRARKSCKARKARKARKVCKRKSSKENRYSKLRKNK